MDPRFLAHNSHLINPKKFEQNDPQLAFLKTRKITYHWPLVKELPIKEAGIYTLEGGRQIGKTTLLKQWMAYLLKKGVNPQAIAFLSGELIEDFQSLLHLLQFQIQEMPKKGMKYLIIDEVSYIRDWDKAIKFAADAGMLRSTVLVLTGSDSSLIKEARARFPGRRGKADIVDFHLYPLSFREYVELIGTQKDLESSFKKYLIHGGYLTAINDLAMQGMIMPATLVTYSDWVRGDMMKRGKQESYLREIIQSIIKCYSSQVTWTTIANNLSIDHPKTVIDYLSLLESMDTILIQPALIEHKLTAAPKKARKISFRDPFIFHALRAWVEPTQDIYKNQILKTIEDPKLCSLLVEACVANTYARYYPTYYIKGDGEVDIAYVDQGTFWPVEVKWANHLRSAELKQISKYKNGLILTKNDHPGVVGGIPTLPVIQALLEVNPL